jgi:hypothetical protein
MVMVGSVLSRTIRTSKRLFAGSAKKRAGTSLDR